jgi:hypothetical protein
MTEGLASYFKKHDIAPVGFTQTAFDMHTTNMDGW